MDWATCDDSVSLLVGTPSIIVFLPSLSLEKKTTRALILQEGLSTSYGTTREKGGRDGEGGRSYGKMMMTIKLDGEDEEA